MPVLTILLNEENNPQKKERNISFDAGKSIRDILNTTDIRVRTGCSGNGACGICQIQIKAGDVDMPTKAEVLQLDVSQIEEKIRLACQVILTNDVQIKILNQAPKSNWKNIPEERDYYFDLSNDLTGASSGYAPVSIPGIKEVKDPCGVAVDLGTTFVSLALYDLSTGKRLTTRYGLNPQVVFGSDVLTRIMAASKSSSASQEMNQLLTGAFKEALADIASQEGVNLERIVRVIFVGNTAILTLLSGSNFKLLLDPKYWMEHIDCLFVETSTLAEKWRICSRAEIEVVPPVAGFVGSDLLAGIWATSLIEKEPGTLLIDFGTNSEMALWDGESLWVTSAAGGPAFEASGISCGMSAEAGAVYRVNMQDNGTLEYRVIGGRKQKPKGICGSGLVDLISSLINAGILSRTGSFLNSPENCYNFADGEKTITLKKKDVDVIQQAKAAIGTGIAVLLNNVNPKKRILNKIYIGGAFGYFLDVVHAQNIGLLPQINPEQVTLCGNTALAGCEHMLLSGKADEKINELMKRIKMVNLSNCDDFDEYFLQNLYLEPLITHEK